MFCVVFNVKEFNIRCVCPKTTGISSKYLIINIDIFSNFFQILKTSYSAFNVLQKQNINNIT